MLSSGIDSLVRILGVGTLSYISLVFLLRVSGRRTLSKMNAFDFVVTIAFGSTLATMLLSKNVALTDGIAAFGLLIGLQYLVTWSSVRVPWVEKIVTGEPVLLFYQGDFLPRSMRKARVTENEVCAAIRSAGEGRLEEVDAVILETDGSFSVVPAKVPDKPVKEMTSLKGVKEVRADPH